MIVFASIGFDLRRQLRKAIDAEERQALTRSAVINAAASVGFMVGILFIAHSTTGWILPVVATLVFMGTVFWQSAVVQPRAMARRHALEAVQDPVAAAKARRRDRWKCRIGLVFGALGGFGGLIAGLVASGRMTF